MSIWSDYEADLQFKIDHPHGVNGNEWTTREGKVLTLEEMSSQHIRNVMNMIGEEDDFYYACQYELNKRHSLRMENENDKP